MAIMNQQIETEEDYEKALSRIEPTKDLGYYLNLPYRIEIQQIPEEEGGGFMARLPLFGELGILGDGDTEAEALADLEETKRCRFKVYLAEGRQIPEP